jgi:hypothetical protein
VISTLFAIIVVIVVTAVALVAVVLAWGSLGWEELPKFSAGPEPTNVTRLPEIDLPLDKDDDDA